MIYIIVFEYVPMYGVQIAFKNFIATKGIYGSPWVGFQHFERFFNSNMFSVLIKNTLGLSLYRLAAGFPAPIILALLLNHLNSKRYKRVIQTATYAPHFISSVVIVSMLLVFLSPRGGLVNVIITALGAEPILFMGKPELFKTIFVFSGIWQNTGWGAIVYLSALSAISPELHESAIVDGASKLKRIIYIDLPGIMPTAVILLILDIGNIMNIGFEKVFLMQNSLNIDASEIIATYVYKVGLIGGQYSFSAAVGLFNSLINFILLIIVNKVAKTITETSLW